MPYRLSWENNVLHIRLVGDVTLENIREYENLIWSDPRFDQLDYVLWDGSHIDSLELPVEEAEFSAAYSKGSSLSNASIKMAMVVTDPDMQSLVEAYVAFLQYVDTPWTLKVFDSIDPAKEWLLQP